jgi:hypothetical protein
VPTDCSTTRSLSRKNVCANIGDISRAPRYSGSPQALWCRTSVMIRKVCASFVGIASGLSLALGSVACGDYPVASLSSASTTGGSSPGNGGSSTGGMAGGGPPPGNTARLPCEVLGDAGNECVSAHSTVRVIVKGYTGPLYQVDSGSSTLDINSVDGYADAAAQDQFCAAGCTISIIYDQSGRGNHLAPVPPRSGLSRSLHRLQVPRGLPFRGSRGRRP